MSPSAILSTAATDGHAAAKSDKAVPHLTIGNVPATSESFQLFPASLTAQYRALAPALELDAVTHVNSGYQAVMNLRVKEALDRFLMQAVAHPHPKANWIAQTAAAHTALANHLQVPPSTLAFTRDTTEGLNLFQRSIKFSPGDNVVVLEGEHPHHVYGWLALRDAGLEVRRIPDGKVDFANSETFLPYVDDRTRCVGISSVMFHSGQLNDVADISAVFRPRGIHVLVDMTQHIGAAPINLAEWNVSAAAFGTHKALGCPTGLGALYINEDVLGDLKTTPPMVGAGAIANLQADLVARAEVQYHPTTQRYAHLNLSLISAVALGASLSLMDEIGMHKLENHYRALGRELINRLEHLGVDVVGSRSARERSPHIYIVELLHPDWKSHFEKDHVYVTHYRRGVRVSFGFYNSVQDVEAFARSVSRGLTKGIPKV